MIKKYSSYLIAGIATLVLVMMFALNVMASHDGEIPFATDKSDRTMLKEILVNQQQTHALLLEIKGMLKK